MDILSKRPSLFFLIGVVLISFSPILVKLSAAPALTVGFYRHAFGTLFLIPLVLLRRDSWSRGKLTVLLPLLAGGLFFVDLWGWHTAIGYIGPGLATLVGNFQVFFVTLFGVLFLKERPSLRFWLAIPLALAGVYFLSQVGNGGDNRQLLGVLLSLMAALCYAAFLLLNRKSQSMARRISAEMNLVYITLCAGVLSGSAMAASGESFRLENATAFWTLLAYGFFPHFLGWIILIRCLPLVRATVASMTLLLQPVLTFAWEVMIFAKMFTPLQIAGAVLAIVAIYMGTVKSRHEME